MSRLVVLSLAIVPAAALAHPGHFAEQLGHSHWVAVAATLTAASIVIVAFARALAARRRRRIAHD